MFMTSQTRIAKIGIIACYTVSLTQGQTLLCKSIRSSTVRRYINAISKFYADNDHQDPTKDANGKPAHQIQMVIQEQRRWETVPNRREPVTWEMVAHQQRLASPLPSTSLDAALADWLVVGLYAGFRLSEWAQPANVRKYQAFQLNVDGTSRAFIASDFDFHDDGTHFTIRWRFQKNNQNGERVTFAASNSDPSRCPLAAAKRIMARAKAAKLPSHWPLACYLDNAGAIRFISDGDIVLALRRAAMVAHNISPNSPSLATWCSHSIRVGACVLFHATGASSLDIQRRLRWRSDTFMMYLRNTIGLADAHSAALSSLTTRIK